MDGLAHALDVKRTDGAVFGTSPSSRPQIFGGQLVAQALLAAYDSAPGKNCHSLHGYFLSRGDVGRPLEYRVDVIKNGRRYVICRVTASQGDRTIFALTASFQSPDAGPEHQLQAAAPRILAELPPVTAREPRSERHQERAAWAQVMTPTGLETRSPQPTSRGELREARKRVWLRAEAPLGAEPTRHQAALAYASDYLILLPALLPHGLSWLDPTLEMVSLDHAIWFHRPTDFNQWHLVEIESPVARGGRALGHASIYDAEGRLVATVVQEGIMRLG